MPAAFPQVNVWIPTFGSKLPLLPRGQDAMVTGRRVVCVEGQSRAPVGEFNGDLLDDVLGGIVILGVLPMGNGEGFCLGSRRARDAGPRA